MISKKYNLNILNIDYLINTYFKLMLQILN